MAQIQGKLDIIKKEEKASILLIEQEIKDIKHELFIEKVNKERKLSTVSVGSEGGGGKCLLSTKEAAVLEKERLKKIVRKASTSHFDEIIFHEKETEEVLNTAV